MDYVIQRNLNDSNIKKCNNPNCKKNKHVKIVDSTDNDDLIAEPKDGENHDLIAESKDDENSDNDDLIAEPKDGENDDLIAESKDDENSDNHDLIAESKDDENSDNDDYDSGENFDNDECSCEYDDNDDYNDDNNEEYDNNTNYQPVHFGINSLINNPSFSDTPFSPSNEINNIFSNIAMNLMSELIMHNAPTEDIVCTLDDTDKENLKKINLENDLEDKCNVCMDQMKKGEEVLILPCNHTFHTCCIEEWLTKYNYRCPVCKQEVGKPKYNI
jgi:hypothetical protein